MRARLDTIGGIPIKSSYNEQITIIIEQGTCLNTNYYCCVMIETIAHFVKVNHLHEESS